VTDADSRLLLARRLRALREEQWPDLKITQPQLGRALGGEKKPLSVPLISSWESQTNPKIPPYSRLEGYAQLFATRRSFDGGTPRLIKPDDMDAAERQAMAELRQELGQLRTGAMRAASGLAPGAVSVPLPAAGAAVSPGTGTPGPAAVALDLVEAARMDEVAASLNTGPWRFRDGKTVTLVCAQLPDDLRAADEYTDLDSPDYIQLYTYSELDALFELYGHLRAANPANQIDLRIADLLTPDEFTSHLVSLGGIDWNAATSTLLQDLQLPVNQVANWGKGGADDDVYFESDDGQKFRPGLDEIDGKKKLQFDVALFARAVNPYNKLRTVTICSGMYGRGTFGAVRALTDARFRDRNTRYVNSRFGNTSSYCIITRVPVRNGATITPDWTEDDFKLFEWSAGRDAGEW
jgi:hypothetical protein